MMAGHSLQLAAEEFRKIREPKNIQTKRGILGKHYAGIQFLVKNIKMYIQELRLLNLGTVQLIKDYTSNIARGVVEFYLDSNSTWNYKALIEHLRNTFWDGWQLQLTGRWLL